MEKVKYYFQKFLSFFNAIFSEKQKSKKLNQKVELRIKIEEVPNDDILIYHISDELTTKRWSFNSMDDLQFGGLHSVNLTNEEVPEELQHLIGAFLSVVKGLVEIDFTKHKIRFTKSPVFNWNDLEEDIFQVIQEMMGKGRKVVVKERVRMSLNEKGFAHYSTLKV